MWWHRGLRGRVFIFRSGIERVSEEEKIGMDQPTAQGNVSITFFFIGLFVCFQYDITVDQKNIQINKLQLKPFFVAKPFQNIVISTMLRSITGILIFYVTVCKSKCWIYWIGLSWAEYSNLSHEYSNFCFAALINDAIW